MSTGERAFVAVCTWVVDDVGTRQTFLVGTRGFSTSPTDTPPNTVVRELLKDPGSYQSDLFSGARTTGLVRPAVGGLGLINEGGVLDDWASFGISGGPVLLYDGVIGTPFPAAWTLVFKTYGAGLSATVPNERTGVAAEIDFDRIKLSLQGREVLLDTPVATQIYTAGDTYVTGTLTKKRPVVLGEPGWTPLTLLDPNLLIYEFQTTAADARFLYGTDPQLYVPHDGGVPYTYAGFYASAQDGIDPDQAPAPGHYKVWAPNGTTQPTGFYSVSAGPCFVRLGSKPVGELRIKPLGLYLASQAEGPRRWTFVDLCQRAGISDVTNASLAPGSYVKQAGNRYLDAEETYLEVMNDAAAVTFTAFGFDRLDRFFTIDLRDPDDDLAEPIECVFTEHNSRNFRRLPVPGQERPIWQVNGSAGKTYPSPVLGGATAAVQEELARDPWRDRWTVSSASVRAANPGAISVDVSFDGNEFADGDAAKLAHGRGYIERYGGRREIFALDCTEFEARTIGIELGARVQIRRNRFGCNAGRQFRVVTRKFNLAERTITFGLWGGTTGPSDAVLGGGTVPALPAVDYSLFEVPAPEIFCLIAVEDLALIAINDTPAPEVYAVIEGGSALTGPVVGFDPNSWTPAGDPHWSNVIFQNHFNTPSGGSGVNNGDESNYSTSFVDGSASYDSASPIEGANSVRVPTTVAGGRGGGYLPLTEGIVGTQAWTWEIVLDPDATQRSDTVICTWGSNTSAFFSGAALLMILGANVYFFVYDFSPSTPLLVSTTDIRGAGPVHVAITRGNSDDWYLGIGTAASGGVIEDAATWSGSLDNGVSRNRYIGGHPNGTTALHYLGLYDATRETVGVGRYTSAYVAPWVGGGTPSTLTPLTTLLDLRFEGSDAATSTVDSSVYAHDVTLIGTAQLDTAQFYAGASSLYLPNVGDRAEIADGPAFTGITDFKLLIAIRPNTVTDAVLVTKRSAAIVPAMLQVVIVSGKVHFRLRTTESGSLFEYQAIGDATVLANVWTLIEFSRVGDQIACKVDDVVDAYMAPTDKPLLPIAAPWTVGADFDGSNSLLGHIDAVLLTV